MVACVSQIRGKCGKCHSKRIKLKLLLLEYMCRAGKGFNFRILLV